MDSQGHRVLPFGSILHGRVLKLIFKKKLHHLFGKPKLAGEGLNSLNNTSTPPFETQVQNGGEGPLDSLPTAQQSEK